LSGTEKSVALAGALAILLALVALAQATHLDQPLTRWQAESQRIPTDARWQACHVALAALPHAGLFGFGPGTFRVVFPTYKIGSIQLYVATYLGVCWGSSLWRQKSEVRSRRSDMSDTSDISITLH